MRAGWGPPRGQGAAAACDPGPRVLPPPSHTGMACDLQRDDRVGTMQGDENAQVRGPERGARTLPARQWLSGVHGHPRQPPKAVTCLG